MSRSSCSISGNSYLSRRRAIGIGAIGVVSFVSAYEIFDTDSETTGTDGSHRGAWNLDVTSRIPGQGIPRPGSGGGGPDLSQCDRLLQNSYGTPVSDFSLHENRVAITQDDKTSIDRIFGSGPWENEGTIRHPGVTPFLTDGKGDSLRLVIPGEDSIYVEEMDGSEGGIMDFINGEWDDTIRHGLGTPKAVREVAGPTFFYDDGVVDLNPDLFKRNITRIPDIGDFVGSAVSGTEYAALYSNTIVTSSGNQVAEINDPPVTQPEGIDRHNNTFVFEGDQTLYIGEMDLSDGIETKTNFREIDWAYGSHLTQSDKLLLYGDGTVGVNRILESGDDLGLEGQQEIDTGLKSIKQLLNTSKGFYVSDGQKIQNYSHDGTRYTKTGELGAPGKITQLSPKTISIVDGSSVCVYADLTSPQISFGSENSSSQPNITNNQGPMISVEYPHGTTAFMENEGQQTVELRYMSYTENQTSEGVASLSPGETHTVRSPE